MNKFRSMALLAAATVFGLGSAYAAVQTVTATIKFFSDITITQNAAPNFGYVKAGKAATYILSTAGAVRGTGIRESGTPAAGSYTISGSGSQTINISSGNFVASGDSTPSAPTCKYGGASPATCTQAGLAAPTGIWGTTLLVGLTVTTAGAATDGQTDTPAFDLTIVYQ
jgi:hypothetical protein